MRPTAQVAAGAAHVFLGDAERAGAALELATELSAAAGASEEASFALAELALLAMESGAWEDAATHAERAVAVADEAQLDDYLSNGLARAAAARVAIHEGNVAAVRENLGEDPSDSAALQRGPPMDVGSDRTRAHARPYRAG